jgi:hypothetical protein
MKRTLLITLITFTAGAICAQTQIGNSDMENWETVASDEEPVNWNSFLSASGALSALAANQIEKSTDVRPGSAGTMSARIWSREPFPTLVANGNMTLGQIQMNSTTAADPTNHNISLTADSDFSEALTDAPDSIVFWAKYTAASGSSEARMKATLHDDFDYTDPETGASATHVVATAELNYSQTTGWERIAVAFDYSGPASGNTYILVTFASNAIPGGGDANDEVFIDDVELIYSGTGNVVELTNAFEVAMDNQNDVINILSKDQLSGEFEIYNTAGSLIDSGSLSSSIPFNSDPGMYFVRILTGKDAYSFEIYKN